MKLDRNKNLDGKGKYALVKLRGIPLETTSLDTDAIRTLEMSGALDYGDTPDTEFFVIRIKDKYAGPALAAYALAAWRDDPEYALEVLNLAKKAAEHPAQRTPD